MAVTGGIKFFDENLADGKTGTTATATSGNASAPFILDRNNYTFWRSVGSDDTTTEDIEIVFPAQIQFDRIFLVNHNFKEFSILRYTVGFVPIVGDVIGVNGVPPSGSPSNLREVAYSYNTAYYEIPIATTRLLITVQKTQIPDEEKFLGQVVLTNELGTLVGYPIVRDATKDKKQRKSILLNGRSFVTKSIEVFRCLVDFKNYPPGLDDDLDLVYQLFDRDNSFFVWLCGGRTGDPYFKYSLRGWRLQDLHLVQTVNIFKDKYRKNLYNSVVDVKLGLEEAG